jgi:mevalonate kinase
MKNAFEEVKKVYAECEAELEKVSKQVKAATANKDFKEVVRLMGVQQEILRKYSEIETKMVVENDSENYQALSKALSALKK